jgi:ribonuclease HI
VGVSDKEIVIYTDGACSGNPGPGGWAAILLWNGHEKEISGYEPDTTNNRMELRAVIEALKALKKKNIPIRIVTDSQYVKNAFTEGWLDKWVRKGWTRGKKEPVKNKELWQELLRLTEGLNVRWSWTKGHSTNPYNNRCDHKARMAIERGMLEKRK